MTDLTFDLTDDGPRADPLAASVIAGRYELLRELAQGGMGQVFEATDRVSGDVVALKVLRWAGVDDAELRRERAALRWLRLPGVVELLDEGTHDGRAWLAMRRVTGQPFLAPRQAPGRWEDVAGAVGALLENLARVHLRRVVHADLKPSNVLVEDATGLPVILDFGIARGDRVARPARAGSGTRGYMAPEQARGGRVEPAADLYSIGMMLATWLAGAELGRRALEASASGDAAAPLVAPALAHVRAAVRQTVLAMVAQDPAARPRSALDVLHALGGALAVLPSDFLRHDGPESVSARALQRLFAGHDPLLHIPEDAAAVLWARTGGVPTVVIAELDAWVRAGLAVTRDGRIEVERVEIERLRDGLRLAVEPPRPELAAVTSQVLDAVRAAWPEATRDSVATTLRLDPAVVDRELRHLRTGRLVWELPTGCLGARPTLVRDAPSHEAALDDAALCRAALRRGTALRAAARSDAAMAVLEPGLAIARGAGLADLELGLLSCYVAAALGARGRPAVLAARHQLDRSSHLGVLRWAKLDSLVQAAQDLDRRDPAAALVRAEELPPFGDSELELRRQAMVVRAALSLGEPAVESRVFAELADWAACDPANRAASHHLWCGQRAYRAGEFALAAREARAAEEAARDLDTQLAARINACNALLEIPRLDRALTVAAGTAQRAAVARLGFIESHAVLAARTAGYRAGSVREPWPSVVDAGFAVDSGVGAAFSMVEMAIAWRSGMRELALRLGRTALRSGGASAPIALLTRAAVAAISGELSADDVDDLLEAGRSWPADFAVQVVGLLRIARPTGPAAWRDLALERAAARPRPTWSNRLDLLSFDEAVAAIARPPTWNAPAPEHP